MAETPANFWDRLGLGEGGLPGHLPMAVNVARQGPEDDEKAHHYECWCADLNCPLTRALHQAWMAAKNWRCPCGRDGCPGQGVMDELHCWLHGYEPQGEDDYLCCGECGHVFRTEGDLVAAANKTNREVGSPVRHEHGDAIYHCPLCAHDF